jgi:CBS domain containing-hemolysin-like protein
MDDPPLASAATFPNTELSWGDASLSLLWVIGLLVINAFFVAVEFSLVSARRSRMVQLASEGNRQAALVQKAQEQLEYALSTTQLGITLASVLLGWIGATQVSPTLFLALSRLDWFQGVDPALMQGVAVVVVFSLLTYFQIVVGELIPKTLAILYSEPIALKLAWLNRLVSRFLHPFVELLRFSSRCLLRILGVRIPEATSFYSTMTVEELQLLIASSVESGNIEAEERELLSNIFEFGETVASEVMIPRTSIDAVPETATVQEVLAEVAESGHSRYPVYGESLDDIRGLIHVKEVIGELAKGSIDLHSPITNFIREAHFEPENKPIAELLPEMRQHHWPMVVVVDEFGGTAGLITVQDLVEEIVGKLSDGPDPNTKEPDIQELDENTLLIQAQLDIEEINERCGLNLPLHEDYQTLGGFLIYHMQKIPRAGEKFTYQDMEFQVVRMEGPRVDRVKVARRPGTPANSLPLLPPAQTAKTRP